MTLLSEFFVVVGLVYFGSGRVTQYFKTPTQNSTRLYLVDYFLTRTRIDYLLNPPDPSGPAGSVLFLLTRTINSQYILYWIASAVDRQTVQSENCKFMIVEYFGGKNPLKYFEQWWILHLKRGGARIGSGILVPQNLKVESQYCESYETSTKKHR
jgi:hypothetical protein